MMNNMIPYFVPFVSIGTWILVTFILSKRGWADLVTNYQYDAPFNGERIGLISASINGVNYKNALILRYNEEGIYIRPVLLFRLFHKPILVPWKEIKEVRDKKVLFLKYKELIIGHPFVAIIGIQEYVFRKIESNIVG